MPARQKLNSAFTNGAIVVGGMAGLVFESWTVFVVAFLLLIGASIVSGDIRFSPRRRR